MKTTLAEFNRSKQSKRRNKTLFPLWPPVQNRFAAALLAATLALPLSAQNAPEDEKAKSAELANPVASLISVPIQNNWDFGIGSANAMRYTANFH